MSKLSTYGKRTKARCGFGERQTSVRGNSRDRGRHRCPVSWVSGSAWHLARRCPAPRTSGRHRLAGSLERRKYGQNSNTLKTFAQAFCGRVGCAPEDYLRVALKHCLYPRARVFAPALRFCAPAADIQLLEAAGAATTEQRLNDLLRDYRYQLHLRGGFLAKRLKLRVSGNRLQKLFTQVMRGESGRPEP